jgi:hypothetical protein
MQGEGVTGVSPRFVVALRCHGCAPGRLMCIMAAIGNTHPGRLSAIPLFCMHHQVTLWWTSPLPWDCPCRHCPTRPGGTPGSGPRPCGGCGWCDRGVTFGIVVSR